MRCVCDSPVYIPANRSRCVPVPCVGRLSAEGTMEVARVLDCEDFFFIDVITEVINRLGLSV